MSDVRIWSPVWIHGDCEPHPVSAQKRKKVVNHLATWWNTLKQWSVVIVISSHLLHVFNSTTSYIRAHIVPLDVSSGCRHTVSIGLIPLFNMVHAMICNKEQLGHLGTSHISSHVPKICDWVTAGPIPRRLGPSLYLGPVSASLGFFHGNLRPGLVQEYCISVTLCCPTMMICRSWCLVQQWQGFLVKNHCGKILGKISDDLRWSQMISDDLRWSQMISDDLRLRSWHQLVDRIEDCEASTATFWSFCSELTGRWDLAALKNPSLIYLICVLVNLIGRVFRDVSIVIKSI